jgi:hypothetical protein
MGPFGPSSSQFNEVPLHSAPGFSRFPHGDASRRPPCHLLWGLGGVLSFKGHLLPSPRPLGGQGTPTLRLERLPLPALFSPLWPFPGWDP